MAHITSNPALPTASDSFTITFDASKGDAGLKNFTGDVYAHTGVITNKSTSSSDWKYVKANWTENIAAGEIYSRLPKLLPDKRYERRNYIKIMLKLYYPIDFTNKIY